MGAFWAGRKPLRAGIEVGVYAGVFSRHEPEDCTYALEIDGGFVDAKDPSRSNWVRWVNDGEASEDPAKRVPNNLTLLLDGGVITKSVIAPGQEMLAAYGDQYWDNRERP